MYHKYECDNPECTFVQIFHDEPSFVPTWCPARVRGPLGGSTAFGPCPGKVAHYVIEEPAAGQSVDLLQPGAAIRVRDARTNAEAIYYVVSEAQARRIEEEWIETGATFAEMLKSVSNKIAEHNGDCPGGCVHTYADARCPTCGRRLV